MHTVLYMQNVWQIDQKLLLVTWRKAVAVSTHNSHRPEMALFKFGGFKIIGQAAKSNTPPIGKSLKKIL